MAKQETAQKEATTKTEVKATKQTKAASTSQKSTSSSGANSGFKGKFVAAVGRRKTSVAQVRLYDKGKGNILINNRELKEYFDEDRASAVIQPLKLTGHLEDLDISIVAKGGGPQGQAEASRLGIARALINFDEELVPSLKAKGWNTRDDRKKERKKPGLKKARRAPQWSKR